jgi:hypothetical protein
MVELDKFPDLNGTTPELVGHRIRFTFPKNRTNNCLIEKFPHN